MTGSNAPTLTKEQAEALLTVFCSTYPDLDQGNLQRLRFGDSEGEQTRSKVLDVSCSTS